jgi:hypothetical protein
MPVLKIDKQINIMMKISLSDVVTAELKDN